MKPEKADHHNVSKLTDLPNVGRATAKDLNRIDINSPDQLKGKDPYALYEALCMATGKEHDPCTLDILISVTRFFEGEQAQPWWHYSNERKALLALKQNSQSTETIQAGDAGGNEGTNPNADMAKNGNERAVWSDRDS